VAIRGGGILPASAVTTGPACGPDTRTMAIALGGRPDDNAKMVWSRECMAYLFPRKRKGNAIPGRWFSGILRGPGCNICCSKSTAFMLQNPAGFAAR
jgi:hypothetical protein